MADNATLPRRYNFLQSLQRLIKFRLVIPLKRSTQPPEFIARGVAVGTMWAMSPFFGFQMTLSLITWLISTRLFKWNFSLINAVAWTWTTNVFTIIPAFYIFYLTGLLCFGELDQAGYSSFYARITQAMVADSDLGTWGQLKSMLYFLVSDIGIPLSVGSVIWMVIGTIGSYYASLYFVVRYRKRREEIMNRKAGLESD